LDDLERRKRPLAKVNKNSGAHQKNFNEDRAILSWIRNTWDVHQNAPFQDWIIKNFLGRVHRCPSPDAFRVRKGDMVDTHSRTQPPYGRLAEILSENGDYIVASVDRALWRRHRQL